MFIPPELEQELIEFAFIIDNNKKIEEVYLSKGMATILEPYSKRVQEGKLGITDTDTEGNPAFKYSYTESNSELYHIKTYREDKETEYGDTYFEGELDFRAAGFNNYGTNPIIMHIKRLLEDVSYNILDLQDPDITDLLDNFQYFRALLHKRHLEFTRSPIQEYFYDQNIEGTAKLFIPEKNELWNGDDSLLPVHKYEHQHSSLKDAQNIYFHTYTTEDNYTIQTYLVLLEDRIIRLNYSNNFHFDIEYSRVQDAQTYLFADNLTLEEFDVPATPEGFLLLKMLDI